MYVWYIYLHEWWILKVNLSVNFHIPVPWPWVLWDLIMFLLTSDKDFFVGRGWEDRETLAPQGEKNSTTIPYCGGNSMKQAEFMAHMVSSSDLWNRRICGLLWSLSAISNMVSHQLSSGVVIEFFEKIHEPQIIDSKIQPGLWGGYFLLASQGRVTFCWFEVRSWGCFFFFKLSHLGNLWFIPPCVPIDDENNKEASGSASDSFNYENTPGSTNSSLAGMAGRKAWVDALQSFLDFLGMKFQCATCDRKYQMVKCCYCW